MHQTMTYEAPLPGSQPLHELLWAIGKSWIASPQRLREEAQQPPEPFDDAVYRATTERTTVQQVVTALRMQGVEGEESTMLGSLAEMVSAGEIPFADFIGRVQNLFPRAIDALDVALRMKIASLVLPRH